MEAVAADDEVGVQALLGAAVAVAQMRAVAVEAVRLHVLGLVDGGAAGLAAVVHEVARDLGLAVDHDLLAGQRVQVDAQPALAEGHLEAVVRQALRVQPRGHAGFAQQVHRHLLQHAGADAAEHVLGAALLEHDVVDAGAVQQRTEQQAGRAGADDGDLGAHVVGLQIGFGAGPTAPAGARPCASGRIRRVDAFRTMRAWPRAPAGTGSLARRACETQRTAAGAAHGSSPAAPAPENRGVGRTSAAAGRTRGSRMSSTVAVDELRVGMYIHLDGGWLSHPFPLSSFRIASPEQIATLRGLGLARVRWVPEKSDAPPPGDGSGRQCRRGA